MNDTENIEAPIVTVEQIKSVEEILQRMFMNATAITGTDCLDMRFSNIEIARRALASIRQQLSYPTHYDKFGNRKVEA